MTDYTTGIEDAVKVTDESDSSEITSELGHVISANHNINNNTTTEASVNSGSTRAYHVDGVAELSISMEVNAVDLLVFQVFGTYDSTAGTITFDDTLPEYTVGMNTDDSNFADIKNVKFGSGSITISRGESISVSLEGNGKDIDRQAGSISPGTPSSEPQQFFEVHVDIDGTTVGSLDSVTFEIDRDLESRRGIEDVSSGDKRKPTTIQEKLKLFSFDMSIEITDQTAWDEVTDTTDGIADSRSDYPITLHFKNGEQINIKEARSVDLDHTKENDGEVRVADITGEALDADISGL